MQAETHSPLARLTTTVGHKICLCYLPPNMTKLIQPIDSGIAIYESVVIGSYLYGWLMVGEKHVSMGGQDECRWEDHIDDQVELNNLIHRTTKETYISIMSTFECTGCIITMIENDHCHKKIGSQGILVEQSTVMKVGSYRSN